LEDNAGLCYVPCNATYIGFGPICWRNDSGNATYGIECNAFSFGHTQADCDGLNGLLKQAGLTSFVCIGSLAASVVTGQIVGPKICRDLMKNVLPKLGNTEIC